MRCAAALSASLAAAALCSAVDAAVVPLVKGSSGNHRRFGREEGAFEAVVEELNSGPGGGRVARELIGLGDRPHDRWYVPLVDAAAAPGDDGSGGCRRTTAAAEGRNGREGEEAAAVARLPPPPPRLPTADKTSGEPLSNPATTAPPLPAMPGLEFGWTEMVTRELSTIVTQEWGGSTASTVMRTTPSLPETLKVSPAAMARARSKKKGATYDAIRKT